MPGLLTEAMTTPITVSAADLSRLHDEMRAVVAAAEQVQRTLSEVSGGDQAALYLKGNLQRGAGYFRISADTIERLFRARNSGK